MLSTATRQLPTSGKRTVAVGVSRGGAPFQVVSEQDSYPALYCHECGTQLRTADDVEVQDVHTSRANEDVCENCCDYCATSYSGCNCL